MSLRIALLYYAHLNWVGGARANTQLRQGALDGSPETGPATLGRPLGSNPGVQLREPGETYLK